MGFETEELSSSSSARALVVYPMPALLANGKAVKVEVSVQVILLKYPSRASGYVKVIVEVILLKYPSRASGYVKVIVEVIVEVILLKYP